jgi:hypothetical protein
VNRNTVLTLTGLVAGFGLLVGGLAWALPTTLCTSSMPTTSCPKVVTAGEYVAIAGGLLILGASVAIARSARTNPHEVNRKESQTGFPGK